MPYAPATARIATPIGMIELVAEREVLISCRIKPLRGAERHDPGSAVLDSAVRQMREWFAGNRQIFDLPLAPLGSEEGERLRAGIASIPYGETLTYGALSTGVGSVARAVGQACKTNAYPIIIPCHRVTSAAGPEYYSAGEGARTKSWLIDFEYAHLPAEKRTRLI